MEDITKELSKILVKSLVTQAMLSFAIARLESTNTETDAIAEEYTNKILEELK